MVGKKSILQHILIEGEGIEASKEGIMLETGNKEIDDEKQESVWERRNRALTGGVGRNV